MKILSMTASFGRLENETLTLAPGLNILQLPNEAGKSTWTAFLLAMLYGVDTAERAKAGQLPDKTKYLPWSGAPMEGRMELEWQGRRITITRRSTARAPMSQFRAYDSQSGQSVPELTGENCGETLLGVPKSVFLRSALVRQQALAVSADAALETRMRALVTAGEADVSAPDAAKRLHDEKNRCRHNQTGRIPQAERELAALQDTLSQISALHRQDLTLQERAQTLEARRQALDRERQALIAQENRKKLQQKYDAHTAMIQASNRANAAAAAAAGLPAAKTLEGYAARLSEIAALPEPEKPPAPAPAPACPEAFRGVAEQELLTRAQQDGRSFDALTRRRYRGAVVFWIQMCLLLAASAVLAVKEYWLYAAGALALGLAALLGALLARRSNRLREQELSQAQALLARYGNRSRDEFTLLAAEYGQAMTLWRQENLRLAQQQQAYVLACRRREQACAQLLGAVQTFAPEAKTAEECRQAVGQALSRCRALEAARQQAELMKTRYEDICRALADVPETEAPDEDFGGRTLAENAAELAQTERALSEIRTQLSVSRGRVQALGDPAELEARCEALRTELTALEARYEALSLAESTLAKAAEEMQSRFSPALRAEAEQIFSRLTAGRYDKVVFDRQLSLQAGAADEVGLHPLQTLSCGTADQLYLALRLGMCRLLLAPDVPLILDDALVMFDDARAELALRELLREARARQILLFTCQSREHALLSGMEST